MTMKILLRSCLSPPRISHQIRQASRISFTAPVSQSIEKCPAPTCPCRPMPTDLDIDYKRTLLGSTAPHAEHILIHTGSADWPSRIEDDEKFAVVVQQVKERIRQVSDRQRNEAAGGVLPLPTLLSCSSLPVFGSADGGKEVKTSMSLLGAGVHLGLSEQWDDAVLEGRSGGQSTKQISEVVVLVCGHGARDERCGIIGPLLVHEFNEKLQLNGIEVLHNTVDVESTEEDSPPQSRKTARVGMVSHVGGHVFAGNVIIYIPRTKEFEAHALAGSRIWYGRVQPQHVEGIVQSTIRDGLVIEELLRWHSPLQTRA